MGYHLCTSLSNDVNIESKKTHVNKNCVFMKTIGTRLKGERTRLGFNQEDFGAIGGVQRRAQLFYEQDERHPDANYLLAVSKVGVDVQYVITGVVSSATLSEDEAALISAFRALDMKGKARLLGVAEGIAEPEAPKPAKRKQTINIHGDIGQQVAGDIVAPQTINVGRKKK
jgi:transcriptional regulator with XRE-family HTH domain